MKVYAYTFVYQRNDQKSVNIQKIWRDELDILRNLNITVVGLLGNSTRKLREQEKITEDWEYKYRVPPHDFLIW